MPLNSSEFEISTDPARLDIGMIHDFLRTSYWAPDVPREIIEKSIQNSFCFGVYYGPQQVAFARVITDFATMAYLSDLFVIPEFRAQGISKMLVKAIVDHPRLQGLRRWLLVTLDAQGLYTQFGFKPISNPEMFMTIHHPDIHRSI